MIERHPVEILLNASATDILNAVNRGFRTIVDVKGKLAEYYLEKTLAQLVTYGILSSYEWHDLDGKPDFSVVFGEQEIVLECKNVRSGALLKRPTPAYKVELQKTRNSRDGTPTRGYRVSEFDVLAACLFNQTGQWEYLFVAAATLERRPQLPDLLKVMQRVPTAPDETWSASLVSVLQRVRKAAGK
jgi:hypothetical protein